MSYTGSPNFNFNWDDYDSLPELAKLFLDKNPAYKLEVMYNADWVYYRSYWSAEYKNPTWTWQHRLFHWTLKPAGALPIWIDIVSEWDTFLQEWDSV